MVALEVYPSTCQYEVRNTFLTFAQGCLEVDNEPVVVPRRRTCSEPPQSREAGTPEFECAAERADFKQYGDTRYDKDRIADYMLNSQQHHAYPPSEPSHKQESPHIPKHEDPSPENNQKLPRRSRRGKKKGPPVQSADWWRAVSCRCPLSDFPISLLPFPPFKLRLHREEYVLIDGQFLVYQVLSTWKFKVFGIDLKDADILGLDAYIRKCKLGCLRIGEAVALKKAKTPEALIELSRIRRFAKQKLEQLKEIKRHRMARIEDKKGDDHRSEQSSFATNDNEIFKMQKRTNDSSPGLASMISQTPNM